MTYELPKAPADLLIRTTACSQTAETAFEQARAGGPDSPLTDVQRMLFVAANEDRAGDRSGARATREQARTRLKEVGFDVPEELSRVINVSRGTEDGTPGLACEL